MPKLLYILFIFFAFLNSYSQELPPISNFTQRDYNAGIQNWMITQNEDHFLYFANNEGLLEFNGSKWTLYPTPNETIMRSVYSQDQKIYSGAYMDFGYWIKNTKGKLDYTSLSSQLEVQLIEDEQFWGIISYEHWILFQSLQRIIILDTKTNKTSVIEPKSPITKIFKTNSGIYFHSSEGIFEIENGKPQPFVINPKVKENKVINIIEEGNRFLIITQNNGIYEFSNNVFSSFSSDLNDLISLGGIYSAIQLSNGNLAIGTISDGLIILDNNGNLLYKISQKEGIGNNTILSLFEDKHQNLWLGLDNGIDCINLNSTIKNYSNKSGVLGTVYTAITFNDFLYIGTNQGLFSKSLNSFDDFKLVKGTKGQVWTLFEYDNTLFCGHDSGTFIIHKNESNLIYKQGGTWKFEVYNNVIIQGTYFGLSVLKKVNNQWEFERNIENFNYSSKFFEIVNNKEILVSHEYIGLYVLTLDGDFRKVENISILDKPRKSKNASLTSYNKDIYYASREGVFKYDKKEKIFKLSAELSKIFENNEYVTGKMVVDKSNQLWFFTKNYLHYFSSNKISTDLKRNSIPISSGLTNSMPGYENLYQMGEKEFLIGTTNGYYIFKNYQVEKKNNKVFINEILSFRNNENERLISLKEPGVFSHNENKISLAFSSTEFDSYIRTEYQYILEGFHSNWSKWSSKSEVTFENLSPGSYTFKVRSNSSNAMSENIASFSFEIKKPWYFGNLAIVIYIILFILFIFYVNKLYSDFYNDRHQKIIAENNLLLELKELENQKEIMKFRNEKLSQDVEKKNKELAVSTMNLLKKDELLKIIKEDLKNTSEDSSSRRIKSVISSINKEVTNDNTWNVFKDAFDKADNDFIKNIKEKHPTLTPNDLRLCAYLRLNLSSKEIAPLLNISVRSIEIKRYRLRKKMDLPHEQSLVEYILSM
jgi:AraC family transcriptional regulator, chitin signaling transcriptional activator